MKHLYKATLVVTLLISAGTLGSHITEYPILTIPWVLCCIAGGAALAYYFKLRED